MQTTRLELILGITALFLGTVALLLHLESLAFIALITGAVGLGMLVYRSLDAAAPPGDGRDP